MYAKIVGFVWEIKLSEAVSKLINTPSDAWIMFHDMMYGHPEVMCWSVETVRGDEILSLTTQTKDGGQRVIAAIEKFVDEITMLKSKIKHG